MARPRTPVAPGDPVWVDALAPDGDGQAKAGILVRWAGEPMKSNAIVQLADHSAGSHQVYPAEQVYYRRDGSHPSSVGSHRAVERERAPESAASPLPISADPYDQLIDVMGRCADKIASVIEEAEAAVTSSRAHARSIKTKRSSQLRRIRSAIRLMRGDSKGRKV